MHGRIKVRTSEEEKKRKDLERQEKLKIYRVIWAEILKKRECKEYDQEMLQLTEKLLYNNPDIYTVWNIRREVLRVLLDQIPLPVVVAGDTPEIEHTKEESKKPFDVNKILDNELYLTEQCLKMNPKSYCAWYQREWVLTNRETPDWKTELDVCNIYLRLDARNFHTWDYRRYVANQYNVSLEDEFKFTTEMIMENFSNYSAWHYRSRILPKLYPDTKEGRPIEDKHHKEELKLIQSAAFTDPNDTSAWFYQRWLLGAVKKEIKLISASTSKEGLFVCFDENISEKDANSDLKVFLNDVICSAKVSSLSGREFDVCWRYKINEDVDAGSDFKVKYKDQSIQLKYDVKEAFGSVDQIQFKMNYSEAVKEELKEQLESCKQLMELEPENRCTLLAMTFILHNLDPKENYTLCMKNTEMLQNLDEKRKGYYRDLASKWTIENYLENNAVGPSMPALDYSTKLSCLYHIQFWSFCKKVDFSNQQLTARTLPCMKYLVMCEYLDLSKNNIDSTINFPQLSNLKEVKLLENPLDRSTTEEQFSNLQINLIL